MKRPLVISVLLVFGVVGLWYYFSLQPPSDVEAKSETSGTWGQWLTLAMSSISLLTGLVGLLQKIIELKIASKKPPTDR